MRKLAIIALLILLALPLTVLAQDDEPIDINGAYTLNGAGAGGADPYTGTATIDGFGSVYYLAVQFGKETEAYPDPVLVIGDVLIDAYGMDGTVCSDTAYIRMEDGTLLGQWVDLYGDDGIGGETLIPTNPTGDFTGDYTLWGFNADGETYSGMVSIHSDANNTYFLDVTYRGEDKSGNIKMTGYGLVTGNVLGVSLALDTEADYEQCAIYVAQFAPDRSFTGVWYGGGNSGTENGTPR